MVQKDMIFHKMASLCIAVAILLCSAVSASAFTSYTVKEGDTLWDIAEEVYDNPLMYVEIQKASYISDEDWIFVEQVIIIPDIGGSESEIPLSLDEVVSMNVFSRWIGETLRDPSLISHLTERDTWERDIETQVAIIEADPPIAQEDYSYHLHTPLIPVSLSDFTGIGDKLPTPGLTAVSPAKSPSQRPVKYAPHTCWSCIISQESKPKDNKK